MKYIKLKEQVTRDYVTKLHDYIKENAHDYFLPENEAHSELDFEVFPTIKTDRNHLIKSGELCLIDREWEGVHSYVICRFYARCTKAEDLFKVIEVSEIDRAHWRNGYFMLPSFEKDEDQ